MAYDRYDTREPSRSHSRWPEGRDTDRDFNRDRDWRGDRPEGRRDERGFFERAGDEVASWFGDEEAERRRRGDQMRDDPDHRFGGRASHARRDFGRERSWDRDDGRDEGHRRWFETRGANERGGFGEGDYSRSSRGELSGPGNRERDWDRERSRDYRPMTGDYGRSEQFAAASAAGAGFGRFDRERSDSPWGSDEYRSTSRAGSSDWSDRSRHEDPHYNSWRQRHMDELDRDYDDYRRDNQSRFESDFGSWRKRRIEKRGLLGQIREHVEVVGNDDEHLGTVYKIAGDRIILTKSDPNSGGTHHSLSCADVSGVEADRVILDCSADEARKRWRDESRNRALFEREDQGEMGPRSLNRSFEGTYR